MSWRGIIYGNPVYMLSAAQWDNLATGGGSNTVVGTANQIVVTVSGLTSTLSFPAAGNPTIFPSNIVTMATSSPGCVAIGTSALGNIVTQPLLMVPNSIAIGSSALLGCTGGNGANVAIGASNLRALTTGSGDVAIGYYTGAGITTGGNNVLVGGLAGQFITTGSNSCIVGANSGQNVGAGNNDIYLGFNIAGTTGASNETIIGNSSQASVTFGGIGLAATASNVGLPALTFNGSNQSQLNQYTTNASSPVNLGFVWYNSSTLVGGSWTAVFSRVGNMVTMILTTPPTALTTPTTGTLAGFANTAALPSWAVPLSTAYLPMVIGTFNAVNGATYVQMNIYLDAVNKQINCACVPQIYNGALSGGQSVNVLTNNSAYYYGVVESGSTGIYANLISATSIICNYTII